MSNLLILTLIAASITLGACRREDPQYQPLKLGATTGAINHAAR